MTLELPCDFSAKIAEVLNWKLSAVQETFTFEEDKQGYFWAKLKPKIHLDKPDFVAVCKLTRDLGGEDYLQGARAWKIPGPLAKQTSEKKTSEPAAQSQPTYKESGNAVSATPRKETTSPYMLLPVDALLTMPFARRKQVEDADFNDLVENVKAVGVLEPILVRERSDTLFEVVAGDRRHAAAKKAELTMIPAIVRKLSDAEAYEIRMIENIQRKDLTDSEKAEWLEFMLNEFGYTQEQLAKKLGKKQPWVSQTLAILQLPENIVRTIKHGEITTYQAREILSAPEKAKEQIINKINETGEVPSAREIHKIAHPDEKPQIPCARCGEPILGTPIHLGEGKYYDAECAEQTVAESKQGISQEPNAGPFEDHMEQEEHAEAGKSQDTHAHEEASIDVGDFTCSQCKQSFRILHLPNGKHKLQTMSKQAKKGS